jgi:hypothetical protein
MSLATRLEIVVLIAAYIASIVSVGLAVIPLLDCAALPHEYPHR